MRRNRDSKAYNKRMPSLPIRKTNPSRKLIAHEVDENTDLYDIVLCSKMLNDQPKTQQVERAIKNLLTGFTEEEI